MASRVGVSVNRGGNVNTRGSNTRSSRIGQGTPFKSQSRVFVKRLREYFQRECDNNGPLLPVRKVTERAADALGISRRSVTNITNNPVIETPGKKRVRTKPVRDIDSFTETAIRNVVYELYRNKELPTRKKILTILKERDIFDGCLTSLLHVLHSLGFKWKKINNRKFLMERSDIVAMRCDFLRKIMKVDMEKVVFIDETWVNAGHTKNMSWSDDSVLSCRKEPTGKGSRIIVVHAGASTGFIPNMLEVFTSKKSGDYHDEMNAKKFKEWFIKLLKNIEPKSIIVMDNAPYHSVQINKPPTQTSLKQEIEKWLCSNNIPFEKDARKYELLNLVKFHKPAKQYELDDIAEKNGHKIIRLPPYHCQFNAIELIWAQIKGKVAGRTKDFTISEVCRLLREAVQEITPNDWQKAVRHTIAEINSAFANEGLTENAVDELIIRIRSGSSSSDDESESYSSEDDDDSEMEMEMLRFGGPQEEQAGPSGIEGISPLPTSDSD